MASLFPPLVCFLLLHLLPLFTFAQTYRNVSLGSSLSTFDRTPYWNSPSGNFSFGFRPTNGDDLFLLAIWFAKVPVDTIVWTGNEGKPVQRGSKVELTTNGVLSLRSPNGTGVWNSQPSNNGQVTSAAMLDSGNFVLTSNDSNFLWESFQNPTDTLLPGQTLDRGGAIISRLTDDNYTAGRFKLSLQADRNLCLYRLARPTEENYDPYWQSNTAGNGSLVIFNQSGYLYLTLLDGGQFPITSGIPVSTRDFYQRATLDYDGVLRQYTYPKSSTGNGRESPSWSLTWSKPQDICTSDFGQFGSGACGFNSYCKIENQKGTCECAPGYIYVDQNNKFGGCKQNFTPPSCETDKLRVGIGYHMQQLPATDWPTGDYEWFKAVNEDWCRDACLNDCLCAAAIIRDANCWLKKFPLSNGKTDPGLKGKALIKVGNASLVLGLEPGFGRSTEAKGKWSIAGYALLGSSAFLNILLLSLILLGTYWSYHKKQVKTSPNDASAFGVNLRSFTFKELEEATDGFKEELGQGAFSTVYKGSLQSVTRSFVAVKKLGKVVQEGDKEFKAEVSAIGRTNHKNLVQLLGFCHEGTNRLLVYEYMGNGSLAEFLFGSSRPEWSLRVQIALGIARGLAYLHEDCISQIIHCDVKPQNILLDDTFMAKISDFGMAKLLKSDQTRTNTGIRGTKGYVAPEWFKKMAITAKVDVYSFGTMLLEIICCRKNVEIEIGSEDIDVLSDWAYECCMENKFHLLVEDDKDAKNDRRMKRFVMVAIWCIQEDPSLRPSMKKVTQMLEGAVEVSMPPYPSSYISSIG